MKNFKANALSRCKTFINDEEAASAAEYGILAALIAVFIIGVVQAFGIKLQTTFRNMGNALPAGTRG